MISPCDWVRVAWQSNKEKKNYKAQQKINQNWPDCTPINIKNMYKDISLIFYKGEKVDFENWKVKKDNFSIKKVLIQKWSQLANSSI